LRSMFKTLLALTFLLVLPGTASSNDDDIEALLNARVKVEYAFYTQDPRYLGNVRGEFESLTNHRAIESLAHYYAGYVDYRLAQLHLDADKSAAVEHLDNCIGALKKAIKVDREFAEAYALLSGCYSLKAGAQSMKAVYLGPKANRRIAQAREMAPENPRVALLDGLNDYYRPASLGRDVDSAFEKFSRAAELFADSTAAQPGKPEWGHAEVYAMLGEIYLARNDAVRARESFEQALLIVPEYKKAQRQLAEALTLLQHGSRPPDGVSQSLAN